MKVKAEIISALDETFEAVCDYIENREVGFFESGPEGKWQAGQHLNHLIQSTAPLSSRSLYRKIKNNRDQTSSREIFTKASQRKREDGKSRAI